MYNYRSYLRYPGFKLKAFTMSYDDGVFEDERFLKTVSKYGIKPTLNLVYKNMFSRQLSLEKQYEIYNSYDCEVATHTYSHLPLSELSEASAINEVLTCRDEYEKLFKRIIRGFAYPFGRYDQKTKEVLKKCGIVYARTIDDTNDICFTLPTDWLEFNPTCRHFSPKLMELTDKFLEEIDTTKFYNTYPRLFFVWGHTYEFDDYNNWELLEDFAKKIGNKEDIWYATNIELYEYVTAYDNLRFAVDNSFVYNPTDKDVYICFNKKNYLIEKGKKIDLV